MEECRAEAVALYRKSPRRSSQANLANLSFTVSSNHDILSIFKFETEEDCNKLVYYTFLSMARAGIVRPFSQLFPCSTLTNNPSAIAGVVRPCDAEARPGAYGVSFSPSASAPC